MSLKKYRVSYRSKSNPNFNAPIQSVFDFNYYTIEAQTQKEAIAEARGLYEKEFQKGMRNLPSIKDMNFIATRRD
jgi:hypothetical protein